MRGNNHHRWQKPEIASVNIINSTSTCGRLVLGCHRQPPGWLYEIIERRTTSSSTMPSLGQGSRCMVSQLLALGKETQVRSWAELPTRRQTQRLRQETPQLALTGVAEFLSDREPVSSP